MKTANTKSVKGEIKNIVHHKSILGWSNGMIGDCIVLQPGWMYLALRCARGEVIKLDEQKFAYIDLFAIYSNLVPVLWSSSVWFCVNIC